MSSRSSIPATDGTLGQAASVLPQQGIYDGRWPSGSNRREQRLLRLSGSIVAAESLTGELDLVSGQFIHAHAEISFTAGTVTLVLMPSLSVRR